MKEKEMAIEIAKGKNLIKTYSKDIHFRLGNKTYTSIAKVFVYDNKKRTDVIMRWMRKLNVINN